MILINPATDTHKTIPNLALAYIGTISNSRIIDLNTQPEPANRFLQHQTDVFGISIQSRTFSQYKKFAELYKEKYPTSRIVSVSGIIDVECCYPFLEMEENINFPKYFNDELPFPNYSLFDSFEIFKKNWQSGKWAYAILTSQGCPHQCFYCAAKNRPWRMRSVENCYQELKQAKERYNIKSFQILDDCFNFQTERVIEFCKRIKELNLDWYCSNGLRIDKFNESLARSLSESNCRGISFGIESIDKDVLKNIKKGITFQEINKAINVAKKYFNFVNGFFIIGLPGSTYKKDLNSLHWALRQGINAHFSYYLPFDKSVPLDKNFYGKFSQPFSNEYPKSLQKRLFDLTESMRIEHPEGNLIKLLLIVLKRALKYDIVYLPFYIRIIFKKFL